MPALDCVYAYNVIPDEDGLRARLGWQESATGLEGASDDQVRTVIPYLGSTPAKNRLFAVTSVGIFDVSAGGPGPWFEDATFATQSGKAGYGVFHAFVSAAGHYLFYADEENGLYRYTETADSWAAVTDITGVTETDIRFVTVFKSRLWMLKKDSQEAYYLDAGAIAGAATLFPFTAGGQARHGGHVRGMWNWTYDGGSGLDDSLVAIMSGGDVLIYQGTDPASVNTFGLKGVWFCGGIPAGRRICTDTGGELAIATKLGLLPMSKLVAGADLADQRTYATYKISPVFNSLVQTYGDLDGWALCQHPGDNALLVMVPTASGQNTEQLAMSYATGGWFQYRDLPVFSACVWNGNFYFGTSDGRICVSRGWVDGVELANPNTYSPVEWSWLGAFSDGGTSQTKRGAMTDVSVIAEMASPTAEATLRYDFNRTEPAPPSLTAALPSGTWDGSVWDLDLWGGGSVATKLRRGQTGTGRYMAVAVRGKSICRTTVVGVDVFYELGGTR